jgi:hypothetical protein
MVQHDIPCPVAKQDPTHREHAKRTIERLFDGTVGAKHARVETHEDVTHLRHSRDEAIVRNEVGVETLDCGAREWNRRDRNERGDSRQNVIDELLDLT